MHRLTIQSLLSLLLVGTLTFGLAASPAIGVAVASGIFRVDDSRVSGNTSLFEGNTIETGKAPSQVQLHGGVRMQLGSASRGKFYRDRMVLEQGQAQLETDTTYRIEALGLSVSPARKSGAQIAFDGTKRVQVAALSGPVRVVNSDGVLLANLTPGKALAFEPQEAGAAAPCKMTGTLRMEGGKFVLTDDTTKVTVELRGSNLKSLVGKRVQITGNAVASATPAAGASQVIMVTNATVIAAGAAGAGVAGGAAGAAGAGATGAAGAGAAAGVAGGISTVAIIAGVGVAVAGAGIGIGLTASGGDNKPSTSR